MNGKSDAKNVYHFDSKEFFEEYKKRALDALNNSQSFRVSIDRNPNQFNCLFTNSGSCKGQGGNFLLFENHEGTQLSISQIVKGTGFNYSGALCNGFPSAECPLRIEAEWQPICAGLSCDSTKSMNVKISISFDNQDLSVSPMQWSANALITPQLALSASVLCARQGGMYDGASCRQGADAQNLQMASQNNDPRSYSRARQESPAENTQQLEEQRFVCPNKITVQGFEQTPYIDAIGKARVEIPASNACPNAYDVFIFQCAPSQANHSNADERYPASYVDPSEGQWVQTEAVLAPLCDERSLDLRSN